MVQMDYVDSYENVTLDTISCLKFARHIEFGGEQFEPDFLIIGDDDTYINIPNLMSLFYEEKEIMKVK